MTTGDDVSRRDFFKSMGTAAGAVGLSAMAATEGGRRRSGPAGSGRASGAPWSRLPVILPKVLESSSEVVLVADRVEPTRLTADERELHHVLVGRRAVPMYDVWTGMDRPTGHELDNLLAANLCATPAFFCHEDLPVRVAVPIRA
jgi:hypothetical protein